MSEATGVGAKTIHRLLEFDPKAEVFGRNEERPLEHDAVIVDEVSMIDLPLMDSLLRAIRDRCRLILVGDPHQLQSVGPGSILADCMSSGAFPVVTLDIVHRQAQESSIIRSSHRILHGQDPELDEKGGDLFFVDREEAAKARDTIVALVTQRIPESFGFNPVDDVQVLTPMYRGELGADSLNEALQAALNPGEGGLQRGHFRYRKGDKVMQVRNNYEKEVFNGDIGRVMEYDQSGNTLLVEFGGRPVLFEEDSLDDLTLAYAITVHKSQGSEYPAVVLALHTQHYIMLRRNLLYTALTRGRKLVVMVGRRQAMFRAIGNDDAGVRYSGLAWRIQTSLEGAHA
jgi:exodeoxyribonuclease V alpha subunit